MKRGDVVEVDEFGKFENAAMYPVGRVMFVEGDTVQVAFNIFNELGKFDGNKCFWFPASCCRLAKQTKGEK